MGAEEYTRCLQGIDLNLAELLGSEYIIEHVVLAFSEYQRKKARDIYLTDVCKNINDMLATVLGGYSMTARFVDLTETREPEKTGDDIVREVFAKAELKTGGQANGSNDLSGDTDA